MSQQINLFNPAFLRQHKHFSLPAMLQALGLIVAGSLCFYGYGVYQVGLLGKQVQASTARFNAEQGRLVQFSAGFSPQQAGQLLQDEVSRLEKQAAEQDELIGSLKSGVIGNTTGYSEYMRAFARQAVPGLWLTGFTITSDAAGIRLNGRVLSPELLPVYIQRLGKESIMRGKTFAALQMQQPKAAGSADAAPAAPRYVEFVLTSIPEPEARK